MQGFRNYNLEMMQREQLVDMMPSQYGKSISPPLSPNSGKLKPPPEKNHQLINLQRRQTNEFPTKRPSKHMLQHHVMSFNLLCYVSLSRQVKEDFPHVLMTF